MAELGGDWLAIPFENEQERQLLASRCNVMGIPTLTVVGPSGAILATNARGAVMSDPNGEKFPWEGASGGGVPPLEILTILMFVFIYLLPKLFAWMMG